MLCESFQDRLETGAQPDVVELARVRHVKTHVCGKSVDGYNLGGDRDAYGEPGATATKRRARDTAQPRGCLGHRERDREKRAERKRK